MSAVEEETLAESEEDLLVDDFPEGLIHDLVSSPNHPAAKRPCMDSGAGPANFNSPSTSSDSVLAQPAQSPMLPAAVAAPSLPLQSPAPSLAATAAASNAPALCTAAYDAVASGANPAPALRASFFASPALGGSSRDLCRVRTAVATPILLPLRRRVVVTLLLPQAPCLSCPLRCSPVAPYPVSTSPLVYPLPTLQDHCPPPTPALIPRCPSLPKRPPPPLSCCFTPPPYGRLGPCQPHFQSAPTHSPRSSHPSPHASCPPPHPAFSPVTHLSPTALPSLAPHVAPFLPWNPTATVPSALTGPPDPHQGSPLCQQPPPPGLSHIALKQAAPLPSGNLLGNHAALTAFRNDPGLLYIGLDDWVKYWTCTPCDFTYGAALDSAMEHIQSDLHATRVKASDHRRQGRIWPAYSPGCSRRLSWLPSFAAVLSAAAYAPWV
ncbi:unnamed protein product [Closterium sp. NIES-64]|nr:unnamed protein product [Closterium sp. NIES-64]